MKRKLTALLLVLTLIFSMGTTAFADNGKGKGNEKHSNASSKRFEDFWDMQGYEWAINDAFKALDKGIFRGVRLNYFAPGDKITEQEVAVSAIRLIGKETETQDLTSAEIETLLKDIPDNEMIDYWAKPSVATLVSLGYVAADESFNPTKPATRLDIAVLLVKVLGYEPQALALSNFLLNFRDAKQIPADKISYVFIASQLKLITGYTDRSFRWNQPVSRIEAAIMMGRADYLAVQQGSKLTGTITALKPASVLARPVIKLKGTSYSLTSDALITINGTAASFADLKVGDNATLTLNSGLVSSITVIRSDTALSGTITQIKEATLSVPAKITLDTKEYSLAANAIITLNGSDAGLDDLLVGDKATLTLENGLVSGLAAVRGDTVSGTVSTLTAATLSAPAKIKLGSTIYPVAAAAVITLNGSSASFADLRVGDTVTLTNEDGLARNVVAVRTGSTVNGSVAGLTAGTVSALAKIKLGTTEYSVASNAQVTLNSASSSFANLRVGDTVALTIENGLVRSITATRTASSVSGDVTGLTAATSSALAKIKLGTTEYSVASNAQVTLNSASSSFANLRVGDTAALTIENGLVKSITATRTGTSVSGSITGLTAGTVSALAKIKLGTTEYSVASNAVISLNGSSDSFADLRVGDTATLTVENELVRSIAAVRSGTSYSGTVASKTPATGTALAKITIDTVQYPVAASAVILLNGTNADFSDIRIGDHAVLTVVNGLVTNAVLTRTNTAVSGTIVVLTPQASGTPAKITLGTTEYILASGSLIKINGAAALFGDLRLGETAVLTVAGGLVDKVEVTRVQTVVEGSLVELNAPVSGQTYPDGTVGLVSVIHMSNNALVTSVYPVTGGTQILVNAAASNYSGLRLGDAVRLTFEEDALLKLEVTR